MASAAKAAVDAVQDGVKKLGLKEGTVTPKHYVIVAYIHQMSNVSERSRDWCASVCTSSTR